MNKQQRNNIIQKAQYKHYNQPKHINQKMQKQQKFISGDRELYENWNIKRERIVGRGNSYVYQVQDDQGNIQCIKQIRLEDNMSEFIFRKQVELLGKLKNQPHPHIVQYKGSYCLLQKNQFKSRKGYIQMEKGMTNLKEFLQHRKERKEYFSEDQVLVFLTSMLDAFAHLQRVQLAHRDVKPSNIIIFSLDPLFFKICDIGAGTAVGVCDMTENRTVIGTPYYLSPQLFQAYRQKQNLTNYKVFKSDSYSLGLVFLQFLTLQRIQQRLNNQIQQIQEAIMKIKKIYPNIVGIGKVLRRMLDSNVKTRMDFLELEIYITENQLLRNKVNSELQLDPQLMSKLTSQKQFFIDTFQDMSNLSKIISSGNNAPSVKIQLNSSNGFLKKQQRQQFEQIKNIKHINLQSFYLKTEMCEISPRQAQFIANGLTKNDSLRVIYLNLWSNQIKNQGFIKIMSAIQTIIHNIEELSISISSNGIRINSSYNDLFDFTKAQKLKKLQLNFGFNEIDLEYFHNLMKGISCAENVQYLRLDLERMKLSHIHFNRGIKHLQALKSLQKFVLNASNNSIRDEGIFGIAELLESLDNIQELSLIFRHADIGDKGFCEFAKSLTYNSNTKKLKKLKLNFLGNDITEKGLKNGLNAMQNLSSIQSIDFNVSNNKIQDLGAKWIGLAFLTMRKLQKVRLFLDSTGISEKGCVYIGRMISQLEKLVNFEISLKQNEIKLKGVQYICQGLLSTKKVKKLKVMLQGTKIGDYAANYLAGCLLKIRSLSSVDLNMQNCELGQATMQNITKLVKQCSNKAEQITVSMRRNRQIKMELYEQIKKQLSNSRFAIKVDNPSILLQYSKNSN